MEDTKFLKKVPVKGWQKKELRKTEAISNFGVVFVNGSKYRRAKDILDLINGDRAPVKQEDVARKEHYARQLKANDIDPKSEEALPSLYELLGGLIRTSQEQKAAEKAKGEAQKKARTNKFGL